jgi:acyl-CoA thioester hydrolase
MHTRPPGAHPLTDPHSAQEAEFRMALRVYYEDTDAAGVVYYANYLRFIERARTEWLRALGFEQQALLTSTGGGFVVRALQADYLSPARLDDALEVITTVDSLRRASIAFRQRVMRGADRLFEAHVVLAFVDWNRHKPAPLPAAMHQQFEKYAQA